MVYWDNYVLESEYLLSVMSQDLFLALTSYPYRIFFLKYDESNV